jgi:N-hydroxyarylamine O-acetyltransferase
VLDSAARASHRCGVVDLDRYFARTGARIDASHTVTLANLNEIVRGHVESIPFENLDVLLGRRVDLDPAALQHKLVRDRRGGYCFEQNALLLAVLEALGFTVRPLSGRVRYQRPRDYTPARTHLFVRVELDTSWIVDAGVGAMSLTSALRLDTEDTQPTPHEPRRLIREAGRMFHQVQLAGAWHDVCEFTLEEMPPIDREVANWYTSAHPGSHFKSRLVVARALPDGGRIGLLNRELTLRGRDGHATHRTLATPDELLTVLADHFGLAFPSGTRFTCDALDWPA